MSFNYVKIYYGPSRTFHTLTFRPELLAGLRDRLQKLGYRVHVIPDKFENHCKIEMCGYEIFRCNIKNLKFNMPHYLDPVCERAVQAVLDATVKFSRARNRLWFRVALEDRIFSLGDIEVSWPAPHKSLTFASVCECLECCDILTSKINK